VRVPFLDLGRQTAALRDELEDAFATIVARGRFVGGPALTDFEQAFAAYCAARHAVGVNSGTDAIALSLRAFGIGRGDEVITAANTCVATVSGICAAGATPVLADVDEDTLTLDPASAEAAITEHTRALVPVHLYGQCADLGTLLELARAHGLKLVEDAAQAHGAEYAGKRPGALGDAAAYSFYPTKNLGALGDAGAVVTPHAEVAERLRILRSHGEPPGMRGTAATPGANSRLDELQAQVLVRKLGHLREWNERRRHLAAYYREQLADASITLPAEAAGRLHAWHLFVVLADDRERFRADLRARGVETLVHYPLPIHHQPAYSHLGGRVPLAVAERACGRVVSLPLYPELTDGEAEQVVGAVLATTDVR
jgi:dTDP-4-amino-4,6-dideoxygalactose transaminase